MVLTGERGDLLVARLQHFAKRVSLPPLADVADLHLRSLAYQQVVHVSAHAVAAADSRADPPSTADEQKARTLSDSPAHPVPVHALVPGRPQRPRLAGRQAERGGPQHGAEHHHPIQAHRWSILYPDSRDT